MTLNLRFTAKEIKVFEDECKQLALKHITNENINRTSFTFQMHSMKFERQVKQSPTKHYKNRTSNICKYMCLKQIQSINIQKQFSVNQN